MNLQDLQTAAPIRDGNDDLPVEPARTPQGRVKGIGDVGGGDNDDVLSLVQAVHEGKELGDDPLFHVSDNVFPAGAMASISSRNRMLGPFLVASSKIFRRWASLSP